MKVTARMVIFLFGIFGFWQNAVAESLHDDTIVNTSKYRITRSMRMKLENDDCDTTIYDCVKTYYSSLTFISKSDTNVVIVDGFPKIVASKKFIFCLYNRPNSEQLIIYDYRGNLIDKIRFDIFYVKLSTSDYIRITQGCKRDSVQFLKERICSSGDVVYIGLYELSTMGCTKYLKDSVLNSSVIKTCEYATNFIHTTHSLEWYNFDNPSVKYTLGQSRSVLYFNDPQMARRKIVFKNGSCRRYTK